MRLGLLAARRRRSNRRLRATGQLSARRSPVSQGRRNVRAEAARSQRARLRSYRIGDCVWRGRGNLRVRWVEGRRSDPVLDVLGQLSHVVRVLLFRRPRVGHGRRSCEKHTVVLAFRFRASALELRSDGGVGTPRIGLVDASGVQDARLFLRQNDVDQIRVRVDGRVGEHGMWFGVSSLDRKTHRTDSSLL